MVRMVWSILAALTLGLGGCAPGADEDAASGARDQLATASLEAQESSGASRAAAGQGSQVILAFGDSLFAGYGLEEDEGYPEQLEAELARRGMKVRVIDAGASGDTSAAGRQRLRFVLDSLERQPDLVLLELGGNDLLRGLAPEETRANLDAILTELDRRSIPVLIMGMRAPPNYGPDYQQEFDAIYPQLAQAHGAALIPFWLEPIYREASMFQPDRIHPTKRGIEKLVAATIDEVADALGQAEAKKTDRP